MNPKIHIYSVPRSGGTYIGNICRQLFPGCPHHVHAYQNESNFMHIIAYRDFRDIVISVWRVRETRIINVNEIKKTSFKRIQKHAKEMKENIINCLNKYKKDSQQDNKLYFKYEDWFYNRDIIFNKLENFFNIIIDKYEKEKIMSKFNLKKDKKLSDSLGNFKQVESETQYHGMHILTGKPGTYKLFLNKTEQKKLTKYFQNELKLWGYI